MLTLKEARDQNKIPEFVAQKEREEAPAGNEAAQRLAAALEQESKP